jgi:hypothetical protein
MSGTETRQREKVVAVRVSREEQEELRRRAAEVRLSVADYARSVLLERRPLGVGPARRPVPTLGEQQLAKLMRALNAATVEVNKIGTNVNQLAHRANAGDPLAPGEIAAAARAVDTLARPLARAGAAVCAALGTLEPPE